MDVGIPLQISAEGMKRAYHPKFIQILIVSEQIGVVPGIFQYSFLLPDLLEQRMIEDLHHRVPGGDEQDVERFPVLAEDLSVFFGNGEDYMSVRDIDTHGLSLDS